ncbi:MAG: ATP-binding protein [Desulfuromonas sp.]|nr:ATP-binding protein [Desulfuromonas sp.]
MNSQTILVSEQSGSWLRRIIQQVGLHSIQGRLTAIAVLFILGTSVVMGVVGFYFAANFERQRFAEHFELLATNLAGNAELGVVLGDEKMLQSLCDNMLALRDVQSVEILSSTGNTIIIRSEIPYSLQLGHATAVVLSQNLDVESSPFLETEQTKQQLATVRIGYSLVAVEQLKQQLAVGFFSLSFILGMVPMFFYWRLSRAIRAPLDGVLRVAGQVSRGNMDVRADGGTLLETETLARAFNEMLDALQQQRREIKRANELAAQQRVLAEMGKFSLTVAHEIKNPLAIISGSLEIIRKDQPDNPELKKRMIGFIDDEIVRINRLIENFLLFARPQPSSFQRYNVEYLIKQLIQRIALLDKNINVTSQISSTELNCMLQCDLSQFERALFNVIKNAVEVSSSASQVRVEIGCNAHQLYFKIFDHGMGIDPGQVQQMFTPFFTTKAKGTGLGLSITNDILKAHKGTIQVENNSDGGLCFTLSLPLSMH